MYWLSSWKKPSLINNSQSQIIFFAAKISIIYLAYIKKRVIITCLLEYQRAKPPFSIKIKLNVDL